MTGKTQATLISYPNLHGLNIVSDSFWKMRKSSWGKCYKIYIHPDGESGGLLGLLWGETKRDAN